MKYKVTVIIPTYNVEKFIHNAISSIMKQTIGFENIEVILVDNESTDSTRDILKEYSKTYENIKSFFPKGNSGTASRGRNIGMDNANSDFVMFLDADDMYVNNICEVLYDTITETNSDIVICDWEFVKHGNFPNLDNITPDKTFFNWNPEEVGEKYYNLYMWDKIYRLDFLNRFDIRCPDGLFLEDLYFGLKSEICTDKIIYLKNYCGYLYYVRDYGDDMSLSNDINLSIYTKSLKTDFLIIEFLKDFGREDIIAPLMKYQFILLIGWFTRVKTDRKTKINLLEELYDLKKYANFNERLNEIWADFILVNIEKRHFNIVLIFSKIINILFHSRRLRMLYRRIYGKKH